MKYPIVLVTLLLFASCGNKTPYPGFSKGRHGVPYMLHEIGDSDQKVMIGDFVTSDISYSTITDSVFFVGRRKIKLEKPLYRGAIEDCFMMLRKNESATFILSSDDFFQQTLQTSRPKFLEAGSIMKIKLDIVDIQTSEEYEFQKEAFLNWIEDFGEYEKVVLEQFIYEKKLPVQPTSSGIFYLQLEPGTGKKIEVGDLITINYEGRFLNGKFFDSTVRRDQPFQFVYGTEWQVIPGLEKGLAMMREGEKALLILPSDYAFGSSGSSTGIIPPFTSLIYEVKVIEVKPAQ